MRHFFFAVLSICIAGLARAQSAGSVKAKQWIATCLQTMGDGWKNTRSISFSGAGYLLAVEQSERPEGPFVPVPGTKTILKDLVKKQAQITDNGIFYDNNQRTTYVLDGPYLAIKTRSPHLFPWLQDQMVQDEMTVAPEFVLQEAAAAADLLYQKDTIMQQTSQVILSFTLNKYPVRLFISKETGFLTGVEIIRPYSSGYLNIWGDTRKTTLYSFWNLLEKDLHYPLQSDTYVNGWLYSSFLINKWKVNAPVGGDSLRIPDSVRAVIPLQGKQYIDRCRKDMADNSKELAPGVWFLPGPCNTTVVDQQDGLVIIEASYSSEYGELLLGKIHSLFPGKKIKAVISTSDAWLHIGGLRPFAAIPGMEIYHPSRNTPILNRLLRSSYISSPDALAKSKKKNYKLKPVSDSLTVGTGINKIILYTYKTETGERMMMAYFPNHQLAYASDLYQPKSGNDQYWQPHYTWEVYTAMKKRQMKIKNFYAMHSGVVTFAELEKDMSKWQ